MTTATGSSPRNSSAQRRAWPQPGATALFRGMLSLIFLVAGTGHLLNTGHIVERLLGAKYGFLATAVAPARPLVLLAGAALLIGGAGLLLGYRTRWAAILLILVVIPITITIQIGRSTLGPLFKNVAIMGGLLFFATHGAGPYSLDVFLLGRQKSP
ncbi:MULTISPECIES: DoxX family protein [Salinibacter]|nr:MULTISPECIES: DoxX family protein [Salinibacter]